MENLHYILNNNKGDIALYRIIFNVLSDNNTIKNYTNNNNGIFFNMNSIDSNKINILFDDVNRYIDNKKEFEKIESKRETIMKDLSKTIDTTYKTELKELIEENKKYKNNLSTQIDTERNIEKELNEEKNLKNKKIQRIKKSIENYQKPVVYKGSYERIKNVLAKSAGRSKYTSIIEESDKLYDEEVSLQETIYDSESENEENIEEEPETIYESEPEIEEEVKKTRISKKEEEDDMKDLFGSDSD